MALPARRIDACEPIPAPFMSVEDAAERLGISVRQVQYLCRDQYVRVGLAKKVGGRWAVHPNADARLRDIETWSMRDTRQLHELRREKIPATYIRLAEKRRDLVLGFDLFKGHARDDDRRRGEFINHLLAKKKIPCPGVKKLTPRTLRRWAALYSQKQNAGGLRALVRRHGVKRGEDTIGRDAWNMFSHVRHVGTGMTVSAAYDQVLGFIREQHFEDKPEWTWPSLRTVQKHYQTQTPEPARILVDEGPHKFRAKCIPKIARSYADIAAGDIFCGDERTLDFMCRVLGDRGWRRVRPKLTAWLDVRSRMFLGWYIGQRANSDTILSSFIEACLTAGTSPIETIIDRGADYKAVGGKPRPHRKWDHLDPKRVDTAFERLGIETHYAQPRHPWSKIIESHFNPVKDDFDRFQAGFIGGSPQERPWDAEKWSKVNLFELPTLDEVRATFAEFLEAHHEKPSRGDSMDGLSPRQALRQFYTVEPRAVNEDQLELACCRMHGPTKVRRDGVRYQRIQYGRFDHDVWRLQGKDVWIAVHPVRAEYVTLCHQDGTAICRAYASHNRSMTQEELRDASAFQRRCEREVKKYPQARGYLLKTRPEQIFSRQKLAAQARQIPDDQLPTPPETERIKVVRPDIAASAEKLKRAAGAEAMRRLTGPNEAARAMNAGRSRVVDFSRFANLDMDDEEAPSPARRVVDFAHFPSYEEHDDEE